ncbi:MAG: carbamoyl-phosphate synthase large subunit [Desulfobacterales bacterium]|nr:carbamoyl-phosphate synthase large subunit [Desulfobacterales bacterium]
MTLLKGKKIVLIGAGPNRIGQSGECDEGAVEACKILTQMGAQVIVVDSNPDALLTDRGLAYQSYIEPLTLETLDQIVAAEEPDALLPQFGASTGLRLASRWARHALSAGSKMQVWGTSAHSLNALLDRDALKSSLSTIGLETPPIFSMNSVDSAAAKAQELGFPIVLRCDDAKLIADGVMVYNQEELRAQAAPAASEPGTVLLVEASLWGWRQVELEILRDAGGHATLAGIVEYLDDAAIHPGDAIGVTPPQSIPSALVETLTTHARSIADHLNIVGNATLRFAYDPAKQKILVTAVHPRYTRTSALITRVSGLPIARLAALLSAGVAWRELPPELGVHRAQGRQSGVVAVKWPRWDFERLGEILDRLGPRMQALGQAVGFGLSFAEALQKALASTNQGCFGLARPDAQAFTPDILATLLATPGSRRIFMVYDALRQGMPLEQVAAHAHMAPWFIEQISHLVALDQTIGSHRGRLPADDLLRQAKRSGLADAYLAQLLGIDAVAVAQRRSQIGLQPGWVPLPSVGDAPPALCFSSYASTDQMPPRPETSAVVLLGSGPYAIGQGSECDYGLYQAARTAAQLGFDPIVLNCNLTSITTGPAMPGRIYFEPLCLESLQAIVAKEKPMGITAQFGAATAHALVHDPGQLGAPLLGTSSAALGVMGKKPALWQRIRQLGIPQPAAVLAESVEEVEGKASEIGFPLLVASSDDRDAGQLLLDASMLKNHLATRPVNSQHPLFVEHFLEYAIEAQAEVLCDGRTAQVAAVMEHIELAGVHAGDSAWVQPPYSISPRHVETICEHARKVALHLEVKGLLNLRFAIYRDTVYLLEAASGVCRNLATVTKTNALAIADWTARILLGEKLEPPTAPLRLNGFAVRAAVFPFDVFAEVDPLLGPRMRSTGEALALADSFGMAYFKALEATDTPLPTQGTVLITVTDEDKQSILEAARIFHESGFQLMATRGTQNALADHGIQAQVVRKLGFGRPNLVDEMKNGRVQMVINTPTGDQGQKDGSYIRKAAIRCRIASLTTPASAIAAAKGITARRGGIARVRPLHAYADKR